MADLHSQRTENFEFLYSHRSALNIANMATSQPVGLDGIYEQSIVEEYANSFEIALAKYTEMGFLPPLNCSKDTPCKVILEGCVEYGLTRLRGPVDPDTNWIDYSFAEPTISVRNRQTLAGEYDHIPIIRATAAHELFHCIQYAYLGRGENKEKTDWDWWMEASATFMESIVFPDLLVNHEYLYKWFDMPHRPLDSLEDGHQYGGYMFCSYLAEQFGGPDIIRKVLEYASSIDNAIEAIKLVLANYGYAFASSTEGDLFAEGFAVANCLRPLQEKGYSDGIITRLRPKFQHAFARKVIRDYPSKPERAALDHLSSNYYYLSPPPKSIDIEIQIGSPALVNGTPSIKAILLLIDQEGVCNLRRLVMNDKTPDGCGTKEVIREFGAPNITEAWLIVVNTSMMPEDDSSEYTFVLAPVEG